VNGSLPHGIKLQSYGGDVVLWGPGLTAERYNETLATLPREIQGRVIGWRATAQ